VNAIEGKKNPMNEIKQSLWQTIDTLGAKMPLTAPRVEQQLGVRLVEQKRNEHMLHLSSAGGALLGGVNIDRVDLVLSPDGEFGKTSGLSLELSGTCLRLDELRERFGELQLVQAPRGRSLNETAAFSAKRSWGVVTFAFKQTNPDCLFRVTFERAPI
jgi:hypothetical protein